MLIHVWCISLDPIYITPKICWTYNVVWGQKTQLPPYFWPQVNYHTQCSQPTFGAFPLTPPFMMMTPKMFGLKVLFGLKRPHSNHNIDPRTVTTSNTANPRLLHAINPHLVQADPRFVHVHWSPLYIDDPQNIMTGNFCLKSKDPSPTIALTPGM